MPPILEVLLLFRLTGLGPDAPGVPVAKTSSKTAIRAVSREVLREVEAEIAMWARIDPNLARMRQADLDKLRHVLARAK